jgi:transcriptional regulator with XRE-family HTH domain
LLVHERKRGKSLRQLGQKFGISHERVRQTLIKYSSLRVELFPETRVAARLGYPLEWLVQLREAGIINPTKPGGRWLYSEEQVKQIPLLIADMRRCEWCGRPREPGCRRFCRECGQYMRKYYYRRLSPEKKEEYRKKSLARRKTKSG